MNHMLVFIQTVLEVLSIYFLLTAIDGRNKIKTPKLIVMLAVIAVTTTVINYLQIPYHLLILLGVAAACLKICSANKWKNIISDWVVAVIVLFCFQFAAILLLGLFVENVTETGYIVIGVLITENIAAYLVARFNPFDRFLELYYRGNRAIVLLALAIFFVLVIIVTHIWTDRSMVFWKWCLELLILTILYIVLSILLVLSLYKHVKEKHRLRLKEEHERYLTKVADEMAQREHEYKHHLNAIIGIANFNKENPLEAIISYSNHLLHKEATKVLLSPISDDLNIASFINHEVEIAKTFDIEFDYYIAKPFPAYKMPDTALIEILANLINNAFEAVGKLDIGKRHVYLGIEPSEIVVKNRINGNVDTCNISSIGYSDKGSGRGYGVSVILRNCKRYGIKFELYMQGEYMVAKLNMA